VFNDTYSQAFRVFTEARVKEKKNLYGFGLYLGLCNVSPNNISDGNWELSGRSHWSNIFLFSQNQKKTRHTCTRFDLTWDIRGFGYWEPPVLNILCGLPEQVSAY